MLSVLYTKAGKSEYNVQRVHLTIGFPPHHHSSGWRKPVVRFSCAQQGANRSTDITCQVRMMNNFVVLFLHTNSQIQISTLTHTHTHTHTNTRTNPHTNTREHTHVYIFFPDKYYHICFHTHKLCKPDRWTMRCVCKARTGCGSAASTSSTMSCPVSEVRE